MARSEKKQLETALAKFEEANADYRATKKGRFNQRRSGIATMGSSANYHIRSPFEFFNLIEDCYDLERNDAVVGQLLDRRTSNVIQGGFRYEPDTGDKGLNRALKDRFKDWSEDPEQCDVAGESTFHDFEVANDWTHILAGDCGVSITESGHLQFFEPYLIRNDDANGRNDDIIHGVEIDKTNRRIRYFIAEDEVDPYNTRFNLFHPIDTRDEYGRRQFFHMYNSKRLALTRGVSAFAPIFELTGMLEDVNFAKLVQQQLVSCIAFLIEEQSSEGGLPTTGSRDYGHEKTETSTSGRSQLFDELEPGVEVNPGAGKKVTGFSPQIPNAEYFQQFRLILQIICGALDMPISVGMMDASDSTFHGFIGAGNEAKKLWKKSQNRIDRKFHTPVTIAKSYQFADEDPAMRRQLRRLGNRFFRHSWHKPVWQSVKPLEDTQDRLMRLRNAIISPTKMHAELNTDYESHVAETIRDNALAIRSAKTEAIKINAEFQDGQPVHWQQLYPMPTPDGIQATTEIVKDSEEELASSGGVIPSTGGDRGFDEIIDQALNETAV